MDQRLNIITLGVNNLKDATVFYEEKFGWKKALSSTNNITFFQLNGILLSLYPKEKLAEDVTILEQDDGFKGFTLAFNARSKVEVDQLFLILKQKGVSIVKEPEEVFWGGYSGYVSDLDKNLWEIVFNPFLTLDEEGNAV